MYQNINVIQFANDVKARLKITHHSQQNLAKDIGYSRKTLNRILNNPEQMSLEVFNSLCKKLEIKDLNRYLEVIEL